MYKKVILFLIVLFSFNIECFCAEIGYENTCKNNGTTISVGCEDAESPFASSKSFAEVTIPDEDACDERKYKVVFMIDSSRSMSLNNKAVDNVINALKSSVESFNKYSGSVASISLCAFSTKVICHKDWQNMSVSKFKSKAGDLPSWYNDMMAKDGTGWESTDISKAISKAYDYAKGSGTRPMVILITDGYPTRFEGDGLGTVPTGYIVTKTAGLIKTIAGKIHNGEGKLFTYGVDISNSDKLENFVLYPSSENASLLNNPSSDLENFVGGNSDYDFFAAAESKAGGGLARCDVTSQDKEKKEGKIQCVGLSGPFTVGSSAVSVYVRFDGTPTVKINGNKLDVEGTGYKNYYKIDITNHSSSSGSLTLTYSGASPKDKISTGESSFLSSSSKNNLPDASRVGSSSELSGWISTALSEALVCSPVDATKTISDNQYNNCISKNVTSGLGTLYYKTKFNYTKTNGTTTDINECVQVSEYNLPIIITESATLSMGSLVESMPVVYAGAGFPWTGASSTNSFRWYYQYNTSKNNPVFKSITLNGIVGTVGKKTSRRENEVLNVDSSELYTDSGCNNKLNIDANTDKTILKKLSSSTILDNSSNIKGYFKTIDSNVFTSNLKTMDDVSVTTKYTSSDNKDVSTFNTLFTQLKRSVTNGTEYTAKVTYDIELTNACMETDGTVSYRTGSCDSTKQRSLSKLRFTPLKAPQGLQFNVETNKQNYSSIQGISIKFSAACPVQTYQILYDCSSGKCTENTNNLVAAYKYRSIDHTNPFPKVADGYKNYTDDQIKKLPDNWETYYNKNKTQGLIRVNNSYKNYPSNPDYSYSGNFDNLGTSEYTNWSNLDINGTNKIVTNGTISKGSSLSQNTNYCGLGVFSDDCDKAT